MLHNGFPERLRNLIYTLSVIMKKDSRVKGEAFTFLTC